MACTGSRPLATSWPPDLRRATATGAAQRFSQSSTAADVPGSSAAAASSRSSSSQQPGPGALELPESFLRCRPQRPRSIVAMKPSSALTISAMSRMRMIPRSCRSRIIGATSPFSPALRPLQDDIVDPLDFLDVFYGHGSSWSREVRQTIRDGRGAAHPPIRVRRTVRRAWWPCVMSEPSSSRRWSPTTAPPRRARRSRPRSPCSAAARSSSRAVEARPGPGDTRRCASAPRSATGSPAGRGSRVINKARHRARGSRRPMTARVLAPRARSVRRADLGRRGGERPFRRDDRSNHRPNATHTQSSSTSAPARPAPVAPARLDVARHAAAGPGAECSWWRRR